MYDVFDDLINEIKRLVKGLRLFGEKFRKCIILRKWMNRKTVPSENTTAFQ
jgi:hypothetical protein